MNDSAPQSSPWKNRLFLAFLAAFLIFTALTIIFRDIRTTTICSEDVCKMKRGYTVPCYIESNFQLFCCSSSTSTNSCATSSLCTVGDTGVHYYSCLGYIVMFWISYALACVSLFAILIYLTRFYNV